MINKNTQVTKGIFKSVKTIWRIFRKRKTGCPSMLAYRLGRKRRGKKRAAIPGHLAYK
jgi:hypothetical protein